MRFQRRRRSSNQYKRRVIHEAARFALCVVNDIPVESVQIDDDGIEVIFRPHAGGHDSRRVSQIMQAMLAGAVATRRIFNEEKPEFPAAEQETAQYFALEFPDQIGNPAIFQAAFRTALTDLIRQLTDPRLREAIMSVTRVLIRREHSVDSETISRLARFVMQKISEDGPASPNGEIPASGPADLPATRRGSRRSDSPLQRESSENQL